MIKSAACCILDHIQQVQQFVSFIVLDLKTPARAIKANLMTSAYHVVLTVGQETMGLSEVTN